MERGKFENIFYKWGNIDEIRQTSEYERQPNEQSGGLDAQNPSNLVIIKMED